MIMNGSESDTETEINENEKSINGKFHSGFISEWDNDTEGVEEQHPHETPQQEILWAAEKGDAEFVKNLLASNEQLINCVDGDGYTPLHRAAYGNHLDVLNTLLKYGANHNAVTLDLWTPLHSACHWNSARCAAKLMSLGIDVNKQTRGGITPLHLAAGNNQSLETIQALLLHPKIDQTIKNNSNETAYEIAVRSGKLAKFFEVTEPCFNYI